MEKIQIGEYSYILEKNYRDGFQEDDFREKVTEYFFSYDYIFGDYAYDKLRLKGFYQSDHEKVLKCNDIRGVDDYIENYCAYGAKYFLLKKIK